MKVIPIGADPENTRDLILIPRNETWMAEAESQLDQNGTLSGYVSSYSGDEFIKMMMDFSGVDDPELEAELANKPKVYTLEPRSEPIDRSNAASNFWLCGFGLAFSLIICASGGPSIICCVFFMLPSFISLIGYPMRYGRGGIFTRLIYFIAGVAMVSYGYNLMIVRGQFGHIGGDPILHGLGFICTFLGLAAVLATPVQIMARKFAQSIDTAPRETKKTKRMSYEAACSLAPREADTEPEYQDRGLVASTGQALPAAMQQVTDSLEPLGFGPPIDAQWQNGDVNIPTAIQLGCDNMVVCDVESVDGNVQTRLVSVLHDGLCIITLSKDSPVQRDHRMGSNGYYLRGASNDPMEMMSLHLEETATMAEKRDTTVVKLDDSEIRDVCLLARRALADVRAQYGEELYEVGHATYGRFRFPPQRVVGELASV
ncbi:MAG: hypothetical protein HKN47_18525 [Pirellulaceae bacterium]|nr:hypothetical protein [Pirellulaceae bacterium]